MFGGEMCLQSEDIGPDLLTDFPRRGLIMSEADERASFEIIEQAKRSYRRKALPEVDSDGPKDVLAVANELHGHLFELDLRVMDVYRECGCHNHNISTRFKWLLGKTPKDYVLHHRLELARQLLRETDLGVGRIALDVGWGSPSGFSATFKRKEGRSPSEYRKQER